MSLKKIVSMVITGSMVLGICSNAVFADAHAIFNLTNDDLFINGDRVGDMADYQTEGPVTITDETPFTVYDSNGIDLLAISSKGTDEYGYTIYQVKDLEVTQDISIYVAAGNYMSINYADDFLMALDFSNKGGFGNGEPVEIRLCDNISLPSCGSAGYLGIDQDLIIDINGYSFDPSTMLLENNADLKLIDGNIRSGCVLINNEHGEFLLSDGSSMTVEDCVIYSSGHMAGWNYSDLFYLMGSAKLYIKDSEISAYDRRWIAAASSDSQSTGGVYISGDDTSIVLTMGDCLFNSFLNEVSITAGRYSEDISGYLSPYYTVEQVGDLYYVTEAETEPFRITGSVNVSYDPDLGIPFDPDRAIIGRNIMMTSDDPFVYSTYDGVTDSVYSPEHSRYELNAEVSYGGEVVAQTIFPGDFFRYEYNVVQDTVPVDSGVYIWANVGGGQTAAVMLETDQPQVEVVDGYYTLGNVTTGVIKTSPGCGLYLVSGNGTDWEPYDFIERMAYYFRDPGYPDDTVLTDNLKRGDVLEYAARFVSIDVDSVRDNGVLLKSSEYFQVSTDRQVRFSSRMEDGSFSLLIPFGETIIDIGYLRYALLDGYSISLDGSVGVNFCMRLDESFADDTDAYMLFTLPDGSTHQVFVNPKEGEDRDTSSIKTYDGINYYAFQCHVPAKNMDDDITAVFCYDGTTSEEMRFSVESYVTAAQNLPELSEYLDFINMIYMYGTAANLYFDSSVGEDDVMWEMFSNVVEKKYNDLPEISLPDSYDTSALPLNVTLFGTSLVLESETVLRIYLRTDEDVTAMTGDRQLPVTVMNGFKVIEIGNIGARALNDDFELTITSGDQTGSLTVNPMIYCGKVLSGNYNVPLRTVIKAIIIYNYYAESALL
ncbi:MAG: hypothetical protein IKE53_08845 [Clostridiales bacterium]|nr:hypothetical protein [Clostridiales bacterium]